MMKNKTSSISLSSATQFLIASTIPAFRANTVSALVVSMTDTRKFLSPTLYFLLSSLIRPVSVKLEISDLAVNISSAYKATSIESSAAIFSATSLSCGVVVGERKPSVSDKIADNISPAILDGIAIPWAVMMSCMMVAVQASGFIVISVGVSVVSPPTSLWWSIKARRFISLILAGNS